MTAPDSAAITALVDGWRMRAAAATDCGPVRRENQDAFRLVAVEGGGLGLVLADGMGGHNGGREAAEAAVEAAATRLQRAGASADDVRASLDAANAAVGEVRAALGGNPGTTMVVGVLRPSRLDLGHVGDSRAYLLRGGVARPLTMDHSVTGERVRAGLLAPEEARTDPRRNYVTRALLGDPVEPDIVETEVASGEAILLCSDGLWAALSDERIEELMADGDLRGAVRALVAAALGAGSTDNVTAVLARLEAVS
jgi:serine/threonine protein phosphatase PrpC